MRQIQAWGRRKLAPTLFYLFLIWLFASSDMTYINGGRVPSGIKTKYVTVEAGDTLWALSLKYDQNVDSRSWCDWVADKNHLVGQALQVGQTIIVPTN